MTLGSRPRLARSFVSGYSGICYEIKFSGRHRGFDSVLVTKVVPPGIPTCEVGYAKHTLLLDPSIKELT